MHWDEQIKWERCKERAAMIKSFVVEPIREANGDMLIALSHRKCDHLLLQSAVLKHSIYFGPHLSGRWSNTASFEVSHPSTGESTKIWKFGLVGDGDDAACAELQDADLASGAWMLQSGAPDTDLLDWAELNKSHAEKLSPVSYSYPSITGDRFYRSDYASGFPMRGDARYVALGELQRWAVVARKLLFRLVYGHDIDLRALPTTDAIEVLAEVVAYARLYDLVYADFTDRHPAFHVGLATHLWEDEPFAEAMNHLVGNAAPGFAGGLEAVGSDEVELKNHVLQQRSMVMAKLTSIRIELARLVMTRTTIPFTRENYKGKKRLADLTLMTPLHADNDDTSCFGNDVAHKMAALFDLKATKRVPNPPKLVHDTLMSLLHAAARIVRSHLAELSSPRNENPDAPYPYFAVRSWSVDLGNWYDDDGHFGPCGHRWRLNILARAKVEFVPASQAWMGVVGLLEDGAL
ncbi:hypothetical protein H2201_005707 [Coniosporium apollinis]|uniref:BTB domain-containing protein n=1 Tax=Coniosporium apollinis TaxID=61459 RepID=A0ABQ9NP19_9PEZI|nr:hypothetical protein H2201_005707 [Coniosporium apollinis]